MPKLSGSFARPGLAAARVAQGRRSARLRYCALRSQSRGVPDHRPHRGWLSRLPLASSCSGGRLTPRTSTGSSGPGFGAGIIFPSATGRADFSRDDYREARDRAREDARTDAWRRPLGTAGAAQGHLELPSHHFHGVTYRLRVGRRIEVCCEDGVRPPWPYRLPCINPTYPLPGSRVLRPALPLRAGPRGPGHPRRRAPAMGPGARPDLLS